VLENANPAHALLDQISLDLATEASSIRAYVLSQDESFLAGYRQARDREALAVYRLQPFIERMGGEALHTYPELRVALGQWHRAQQQLIDRHVTREEYIARLPDTQRLYEEAFESAHALSGEIGRYIDARRDRIIRSDHLDTMVTMALAFLGLLATVGVAWLAIGLSRLAMQLNRRAREEMAFRQVASALTGAVEVDEVLHEVTLNAALVTRADGAYVEKIVGETVEIVSSSGRGAPSRGTKARYPGSLTQDVIDSGRPVILTDMQSYGAEMAPYLKESCENCELLIVPLLADRQALGALVLLNSATSGRHFGKGDAQRAKALGDLVSLALRRVVMIHREREALESAQLALKTRNEFLGIVSHDLRNPLTAILLSASMLEQRLTGDLKEQAETIRSSAERMQRLIADLLDAARTEGGRLSLHLQSIDTPAMLRSVVDAHRPLAEQKKLKLELDADEPLPKICADPDRLMQLFGNLVGNAIKFTPPGGTVTISARDAGDAVELSVADSGPGIPEHELGRVFERYWQAKKTAHLGAGLGLTIAKGIAESHGGTIEVANRMEGGAVFRFTIPKA
jgi:signal transduction histidine kinase